MERYGFLYGTNSSDFYTYLRVTNGLEPFLNHLNLDEEAAAKAAMEFMSGYERLEDTCAPVSVRYAPLYMNRIDSVRKLRGKPVEPVSVLSINGPERKPNSRDSYYYQLYFMDPEQLKRETEGYHFIDQVFGTPLTRWEQVRDNRSGEDPISLQELPHRITPLVKKRNKPLLFSAVQQLLNGKTIVIRMEGGSDFTARAMELLAQLYSLLPPAVAVKNGFAVYVSVKTMKEMQARTSTRVFVIPTNLNVSNIPSDFCVLQDGDQTERAAEEYKDVLTEWSKYDASRRCEAMETIFSSTEAPDGKTFIETSRKFFEDPFFEWQKQESHINNIDELKELMRRFQALRVGWCMELFRQKIRKENPEIDKLLGEAGADLMLLNGNEAKATIAKKEYGRVFKLIKEPLNASRSFYARLHGVLEREKEDALNALTTSHEETIAALNSAHTTELDKLRGEKETAKNECDRAKQDLITAQSENTQLNTELTAERNRTIALELKNSELERDLKTVENERDRVKQDLTTAQSENSRLNTKLDDEKKRKEELEEKKGDLESSLKAAESERDTVKDELANVKNSIKTLEKSLDAEKRRVEKLEKKQKTKPNSKDYVDFTPEETAVSQENSANGEENTEKKENRSRCFQQKSPRHAKSSGSWLPAAAIGLVTGALVFGLGAWGISAGASRVAIAKKDAIIEEKQEIIVNNTITIDEKDAEIRALSSQLDERSEPVSFWEDANALGELGFETEGTLSALPMTLRNEDGSTVDLFAGGHEDKAPAEKSLIIELEESKALYTESAFSSACMLVGNSGESLQGIYYFAEGEWIDLTAVLPESVFMQKTVWNCKSEVTWDMAGLDDLGTPLLELKFGEDRTDSLYLFSLPQDDGTGKTAAISGSILKPKSEAQQTQTYVMGDDGKGPFVEAENSSENGTYLELMPGEFLAELPEEARLLYVNQNGSYVLYCAYDILKSGAQEDSEDVLKQLIALAGTAPTLVLFRTDDDKVYDLSALAGTPGTDAVWDRERTKYKGTDLFKIMEGNSVKWIYIENKTNQPAIRQEISRN